MSDTGSRPKDNKGSVTIQDGNRKRTDISTDKGTRSKEQSGSDWVNDSSRERTRTHNTLTNTTGARPKDKKQHSAVDCGYQNRIYSGINILSIEDKEARPMEQRRLGIIADGHQKETITDIKHMSTQVSRGDEIMRHLSVRLYDVLGRVGASAEFRKLRQDSAISNEIILTLAHQLNKRIRSCYIFGSSSEGTTIKEMNFDCDGLICRDDFPVVDDISDAEDGNAFLMIRDENTQPGYVKLQHVYNVQPQIIYTGEITGDIADADCEGRICLKHVSLLGRVDSIDERNGPADTSTKANVDSVPGLRCSKIPEFSREWIGRKRQYNWPSKRMIDRIAKMGCFVVGVGHPTSIERNIEWRLSFSLQEREMMFSMNLVQHKCYIVLKIIKKDLIEPIVGKSLNSYHLKTCMFHIIENTNANLWKPQNLFQCVSLCLSVLLRWVNNGYCPNYFIKEENMFDRNIHRSKRLNLIRQLNALLSSGYELLFFIKINQIGTLLKYKSTNDIKKTSELKEILLAQKLEVLDFVLMFSRELCVSGNQNRYDIHFKSMILQYLLKTKSITDHTEQQTQKAFSYILPFVHLRLAQSFAALALNTCNAETKYLLLKESCYNLRKGRQCDMSSSTLFEASVFYKLEQYERCIAELDQLELKLNQKPISRCRCYIKASAYTDAHVRQLSALCVPSIMSRISTCMIFLRSDMSIIHEALQYEMYRSINTPIGSRDNRIDKWIDMAVVDAVVYLHFMQYLVNAKLNKIIHKHVAIHKLKSILKQEQNLGHRETGYNLLGWIHFHEGWIQKGIKYFRKSWSIRPHHNAAKLHIMRFLRDINYQW